MLTIRCHNICGRDLCIHIYLLDQSHTSIRFMILCNCQNIEHYVWNTSYEIQLHTHLITHWPIDIIPIHSLAEFVTRLLIHWLIYLLIQSFLHWLTHSISLFSLSLAPSFFDSFNLWLPHSPLHPFTQLLTYSMHAICISFNALCIRFH